MLVSFRRGLADFGYAKAAISQLTLLAAFSH
jgi:hypothetical protein